MNSLKVLLLTKYGRLGASSRMRSIQYESYLVEAGFKVEFCALLTDELLSERYARGRYSYFGLLGAYLKRVKLLLNSRKFDVIWIEKEALPWWPARIELEFLRGTPYVLDYDDAIFHNYDMHPSWLLRKIFGKRLDRLMNKAALVVGGNRYLANRATHVGAPWVEVLPTVIDIDRYSISASTAHSDVLSIVWIGSPSTAHYLALLCEPLQRLAVELPFVLRVIGACGVELTGVQVENVPWTEDTEVEALSSCDVGIMPLEDSPWEQGKCGYKLIQYMACRLPVVASAVGANVDIVQDGTSGFLARTADDWVAALRQLLSSSALRHAMGQAGRDRVEEYYCLQKTGPRLVELLRTASER